MEAQGTVFTRRVVTVTLAHFLPYRDAQLAGIGRVTWSTPIPAHGAPFAVRNAYRAQLEMDERLMMEIDDVINTYGKLRIDAIVPARQRAICILVLGPQSDAVSHAASWRTLISASVSETKEATKCTLDELIVVGPDAMFGARKHSIVRAAQELRAARHPFYVRIIPYTRLIMSLPDSVNSNMPFIISHDEAVAELDLINAKPSQLPVMYSTDPMAVWAGARHKREGQTGGDIVKMVRAAETQPEAISWFRVTNGPLFPQLGGTGSKSAREEGEPDVGDGIGGDE